MTEYKEDYKTDDAAWYQPLPVLSTLNDVDVKFFRANLDAKLPERANESDAGWDVFAAKEIKWEWDKLPKTVPTGLKMVLPEGWEAQVRSRSGMALKGWSVCNSPGTIDAGYRGEIMIIMAPTNSSNGPSIIPKGTKIAQLVFKRVPRVSVSEIDEAEFNKLSDTTRGEGGFGSTGK